MAITALTIALEGRAAAGTVAVEAGGVRHDVDADGRFSISIDVPSTATSFGLTSIGADGRYTTRRVQLRRMAGVLGVS